MTDSVAQIGLRVQDLMSCQAQLMEVCQQKKRLEESLRQRERELTALKGALKDEVASHDKEMEVLREQYSADMEKLRGSMEQVSQVCDHHQLTTQSTSLSPSVSCSRLSVGFCGSTEEEVLEM